MEAWQDDGVRANAEIAIRRKGIRGVRLHGGPMDGWLVKPDADVLAIDWHMTWPPSVADRFTPGRYELDASGKWATWAMSREDATLPTDGETVGHVFLSYVREDTDRVNTLQSDLEAAGFEVWRDVKNLWPGDRWKLKLREAIQEDALAVTPCFSEATVRRSRSTMFEELTWAAEECRRRNPDHPWIFPVLFDDVFPPTLDLGGGATLHDLQWTLLYEDWDGQFARLGEALGRQLRAANGSRQDEPTHMLESGEMGHEQELQAAQKAPEIQRRLLEIEEERFAWEREKRSEESERERKAEELSRTAAFTLIFAYRDSSRTWARVIARNNGPAAARDVELDIWGDRGDGRVEVDRVKGQDYGVADLLRPGETVHVAIAFTMGSPSAEDLRYRLTWTDGCGAQADERQVPVT